jgi:hypothetical protein
MLVRKKEPFFGVLDSQANTTEDGTGDMVSEMTLVSRITIAGDGDYRIPGSRIGPRGGILRTTPPSRANRRRMASPILAGSPSARANPASRSSLASCSMERPFRAARMRRRRLVFSGSLRMVILAMMAMITLQSLIANYPKGCHASRRAAIAGSYLTGIYSWRWFNPVVLAEIPAIARKAGRGAFSSPDLMRASNDERPNSAGAARMRHGRRVYAG